MGYVIVAHLHFFLDTTTDETKTDNIRLRWHFGRHTPKYHYHNAAHDEDGGLASKER